ncbi:MAG: acyl dehydratase, partial [Pseudomonadota bacterium]
MNSEFIEYHQHPPSAIAFMARALLPSPGLPKDGDFPRIIQRWTGLRFDRGHLAAFRTATGLRDSNSISILYPHVLGFRLQMALLTHPAYPLPIWGALQIRNRLVRHRHIGLTESLELETCIGEHRLLEKGVEIDVISRLIRGSVCCWESVITYFYRGRFGAFETPPPSASAPDLTQAATVDRFQMPTGGGWRFGKLSGDYNGIHSWSWYARRLGFRAAFFHPQRVVGMCMARLHEPDAATQTLQLWIKGPVFY